MVVWYLTNVKLINKSLTNSDKPCDTKVSRNSFHPIPKILSKKLVKNPWKLDKNVNWRYIKKCNTSGSSASILLSWMSSVVSHWNITSWSGRESIMQHKNWVIIPSQSTNSLKLHVYWLIVLKSVRLQWYSPANPEETSQLSDRYHEMDWYPNHGGGGGGRAGVVGDNTACQATSC